jgi:hypothetical protein
VGDGIVWNSRLCGLAWGNAILDECRSVAWQMSYLPSGKDKVQKLIVIFLGFSIIFAGCGKRDVVMSGLPTIDKKEEPVKWRPGAGTVIVLGSAALLFLCLHILAQRAYLSGQQQCLSGVLP